MINYHVTIMFFIFQDHEVIHLTLFHTTPISIHPTKTLSPPLHRSRSIAEIARPTSRWPISAARCSAVLPSLGRFQFTSWANTGEALPKSQRRVCVFLLSGPGPAASPDGFGAWGEQSTGGALPGVVFLCRLTRSMTTVQVHGPGGLLSVPEIERPGCSALQEGDHFLRLTRHGQLAQLLASGSLGKKWITWQPTDIKRSFMGNQRRRICRKVCINKVL